MMRRVRPTTVPLSLPAFTTLPLKRQQRSQANVPPRRPLFENDNFLSGTSARYIESIYDSWKADRSSVNESWDAVFSSSERQSLNKPILSSPIRVLSTNCEDVCGSVQSLDDCARLTLMIRAFEDYGHLAATTDPLGCDNDPVHRSPDLGFKKQIRLDLKSFGFSPEDYERVVRVGFRKELGGLMDTSSRAMTIKGLHQYLTKCWCGNVGYELTHIDDSNTVRFVREAVECDGGVYNPLRRSLPSEERLWVWDLVASAVHFEDFFKRKYTTQKRFGCDGAESLIVGLRSLTEAASIHGVEKINLCMAHRGRLNVLYNVIGKSFPVILKEFVGVTGPELEPFKVQSDVKYHLGARSSMKTRNGKAVTMELLANPSHLEAVNPVLQGYTRAAQLMYESDGHKKVLPVEVHGDAAFSGQGIAFETMCISEVPKFSTGGTVHVVVNNQIGFTTDPNCSRSSAYCTDLGRAFHCPILHVNGDSPEDVARVFAFAVDFRSKFGKSIVIDLVCYRRYGHNENDDPTITQPLLYKQVHATPDVFARYSESLLADGLITPEDREAKCKEKKELYGKFQEEAAKVVYADYLRSNIPELWKGMRYSDQLGHVTLEPTAVPRAKLQAVIDSLKVVPDGFVVNPKLKAVLDHRVQSLEKGVGIDWGAAEALAFGSLLLEGTHVRVMGQDVERGTFAHRHAVLHDQIKEGTYTPLDHIDGGKASFIITNSPLNEYGVLGYASGYSLVDPNALVIWEAQFGDFANGAAIIFDQFLSSAESKWNQQQAVVVALPHGFDGRGAEHSSGRIERFLQGVSEDVDTPAYSAHERSHRVNMEVAFPSTPAQYFHLLRRHVRRNFRKPLVLFFSKQFLRAPNESTMEEITSGTFCSVIGDASVPPERARRLVLCTGQIYHILHKYRGANNCGHDVALVRLEELAPFPVAEVQKLLLDYRDAELMWAQEEPRNQGAFYHVESRIDYYTEGKRDLLFAGRGIAATPSTAFKSVHEAEERHICEVVFS
ncbi:2 oxoglutarate dehydrogenase N terminus ansketolase pyrimidine binding domain [Trypanosoma vivax]|uniref:oxoglutarate dehydrogenase (succinyl-transferring) n=1 Tax=Trypanosoma vivax (strain Y486) TaxID=1055687 RepID=G0UCN2_TRYVY|nr:putative 2-oxoglutarate dehydrogenase E1 component [Trypanosoma vivax]KAH8607944.1 2 oxoglutarate dehydrogenase N terminus ansketolase pyrimidine binding domain [Trypanosoma vivax]CCC53592.1 putative 2-oxoglutarate dehydrogenase E1 component [Trypanosoma vivax Y486]